MTGGAALAALSAAAPAAAQPPRWYLVPGYRPDRARFTGQPLASLQAFNAALPPGFAGRYSLVTRLSPTGETTRILLPIVVHQVAVAPDGRSALASPLEGEAFARLSLNPLAVLQFWAPHAAGFVGGGHAVFTPDGRRVFVTERRRPAPFSGDLAAHEGRVVVRDAESGRILAVHRSGGIAPHDIGWLPGERLLAIAHYGSPDSGWGPDGRPQPPGVVEPSVALLDAETGQVVERFVQTDRRFEIRHLTAAGPGRVFAVQTRLTAEDETGFAMSRHGFTEADETVASGMTFAPAPPLTLRLGANGLSGTPAPMADPFHFRQAQSVAHDPRHDEVLCTFTSAQSLGVFDAGSGRLKRMLRTDALGLSRPRGVALLPDGRHYAVSGHWRGLLVMRRGAHEPVPALSRLDALFFGHSHLSVA